MQTPGCGLKEYKLQDIWNGAVASETVLEELYLCSPLGIGQDKDSRTTGTVKDPRFIVPKDCDFMILDGGEQQPQHFLGEGFAVTMSTAAKNTLTVDWRFVMRDVGGNRDVFFVQNDYHMEATSLDAVDVQERYLALQAEFVRYCKEAQIAARFQMVWMTNRDLPAALVKFANSSLGEGIILIGPEALMRVCPMMHSLSLLHGPKNSMADLDTVFPTPVSQEMQQRQHQQDQQRLLQQQQHRLD